VVLWGGGNQGTHKSNPARVWVQVDVIGQISARHPLRHNLKRVERYTFEGNDVGVV